MTAPVLEDLLRELTPQVLGVLVRRQGQFEGCEDYRRAAKSTASLAEQRYLESRARRVRPG